MRYRQLSSTGDSTFGSGNSPFLVDSPATVAQAIQTSLLLWQGEWFLDNTVGVLYLSANPVNPGVLGAHTQSTQAAIIRAAILGVQGVVDIESFSANLNPVTRVFESVSAGVDTIYGTTTVTVPIP